MNSKTCLVIHLTILVAVVSLICITADADPNSYFPNPPRGPTLYVAVPGISQDIPASYETIGMRQAHAAAANAHYSSELASAGIRGAWLGIAIALNTMSDTGVPGEIMAADVTVPQIKSGPLSESALRLYRMRIQASEKSADIAEAKSVQFSGDTQAELRDAVNELQARKAQLDSSITAAEASGPNVPDGVRFELADNYRRYSEAATRVELLASS